MIDCCTCNLTLRQSIRKRRLIDTTPSRHVHKLATTLHRRKSRLIYQIASCRGQWTAQYDKISLAEQRRQLARCIHFVRRAIVSRDILFYTQHSHSEDLCQFREPRPDLAKPNDQHRLATKVVFSLRMVGNHWPPIAIVLLVPCKMQLTGQRQNKPHSMMTHRIGVHTTRIG